EGELIDVKLSATSDTDEEGEVIESRAALIDETERLKAEEKIKASLEEKEVLLKEIHHRVKNNLTVIASMLEMQADAERDTRTGEVLQESHRRVMLMAQMHENLHRQDNLNVINAREFLNTLVNNTKASGGGVMENLSYHVNAEDIHIDVNQANTYGQIISELISNCQKHGFVNGQPGNIDISLRQKNGGGIDLIVADDGKGLPEDFDFEQMNSLGLKLVRSLAAKFGGKINIDGASGTRIQINFPEQPS
ncbi:MAG: histidine kinase dimerization/phosphoacceptor domain -containing protein, partial [Rhodospirillales bacterium]